MADAPDRSLSIWERPHPKIKKYYFKEIRKWLTYPI